MEKYLYFTFRLYPFMCEWYFVVALKQLLQGILAVWHDFSIHHLLICTLTNLNQLIRA